MEKARAFHLERARVHLANDNARHAARHLRRCGAQFGAAAPGAPSPGAKGPPPPPKPRFDIAEY